MGENNKLKVRHISAKETATDDNRNALANEVVIGRNGHYLLFDDTSKAIKNLTKHWFIPDGTYAHDSKYVLQWDNTNKKFSLVAESTGGWGGSNSLPAPASAGNWYLVSSGSGDSMTFTWATVTDHDTTYYAGAGIESNADKFSVDIASDSGLTFSAYSNNMPTDASQLKLKLGGASGTTNYHRSGLQLSSYGLGIKLKDSSLAIYDTDASDRGLFVNKGNGLHIDSSDKLSVYLNSQGLHFNNDRSVCLSTGLGLEFASSADSSQGSSFPLKLKLKSNPGLDLDTNGLGLNTMSTSALGGAMLSVDRDNTATWTTLNNPSVPHDGNNYNQLEIGFNDSGQLYASILKKYVIPQIPTNSEEKLYLLKVNGSTKSWQEYTAPSAGQTYGLMTTSANGLGRLGINGVTTLPKTGWENISSGKIYPVSRTSTGNLGVRIPSSAERPKVYRYDDMLHDSNNHLNNLNIRSGLSSYSRAIEDVIVANKEQEIVLQVPDLIMNELYKVEIDFDATCLNRDPGHNIIFELIALSNSSPVFNSLLSTPKMQTETNYMYRFSMTFVFESAGQFLDLIFASRCGNPIDTLLIDPSSISVVLTKVD